MSKHERQHNVSEMNNNDSILDENPTREVKRARIESEHPPSTNSWPTLYINTQIKDDSIQIFDQSTAQKQTSTARPTGFSSCFSTDQLLMPDPKKSPSFHHENFRFIELIFKKKKKQILYFLNVVYFSDFSLSRSLEILRSNSSHSTDENHCIPCSHHHHLTNLRMNISTLLRMLIPQLPLYYPSLSLIDGEFDHSIDRLVANLIQLPSYYGPYSGNLH